MWGVILALQSSGAVHLGVENLGVVRHVGRLWDGRVGSSPIELVNDGDLLLLIERMLHCRGLDTARITEVKGHADESMVLDGRVREQDRVGNNAADEAGLFLPGTLVFGTLSGSVCLLLLSLLMMLLIGPTLEAFWFSGWRSWALYTGLLAVTLFVFLKLRDMLMRTWFFMVGFVGKISLVMTLLMRLLILGVGELVLLSLMLVILYELWAGERLSLEKAVPHYPRPGPISVSAVPFGPGIDVWHCCRFIGA